MPQSDSSQIESLDEELVAYLDGQLDPESARQVEQRLASEETARRRLQQLAQSWDMLDQLPTLPKATALRLNIRSSCKPSSGAEWPSPLGYCSETSAGTPRMRAPASSLAQDAATPAKDS